MQTCPECSSNDIGTNVAPATANKNLRTLRAILQKAVKRGYLRKNPAADVRPVREPDRKKRVLSAEELDRVLAACPNQTWQTFVLLAVTTGMRESEMTFLTWEDMDLDAGVVHIACREGHRTKSGKSRTSPILPVVVEMLERLRMQTPGEWVFTNTWGNRLRNNIMRTFGRILKRAKVAHCTIHDLRRTCLSHLASEGVNEAVAQEIAGHASITTTLKYYTEIVPDATRAAVKRLPYAACKAPMLTNSWHERSEQHKAKTA